MERAEMVESGRGWYFGLPPPPRVRDARAILPEPSTIGRNEGEGEKDSLFDGPYTPDAPAPISVPVPEEHSSLSNGSCTPLTPSEQRIRPPLSTV